jgi:hypothetical protein
MTGLAPAGLRLPGPAPSPTPQPVHVTVSEKGDGEQTTINIKTGATTTKRGDGSVVVNLDPKQGGTNSRKSAREFDANLADFLSRGALDSLASDLLEAYESDKNSRSEFMENLATGITLLALKVEMPKSSPSDSSAPLEGMSTLRSPILLDAVTKFQSNARGELLPANGPVKVKIDGTEDEATQELANDLEMQMNHYLTVTSQEYYPDTDRLLFQVGFSGSGFKKIYHCPIRRRPVSDMVLARDLVVNQSAIDLTTAGRITHVMSMRTNIINRMVKAGAYRKVELSLPTQETDSVKEEVSEVTGISAQPQLPKDYEHTILEMYVETDLNEYDNDYDELKGTEKIHPPYKVVIERDSRQILEIRRNWKKDDPRILPRRRFVKYPFIPGLGFYDLGLLHLLGNTTLTLTALTRQLVDAGQFANFPGFLYAEIMGRQTTNQFRVPPGGGAPLDTNGMSLKDCVLPLPYKGPDPTLMALSAAISAEAQRLGGTAEIKVGEGSQNAPVGTTIALIEQATKVVSAVHKRLHAAQAEEFRLLRELLIEDPDALFIDQPNSPKKLPVMAALGNFQLVPAADPNVPSHMHRVMLAQALFQMALASPQLFNLPALAKRILKILGIPDVESVLNTQPQQQGPTPEMIAKGKELELKKEQIEEQKEGRIAAAEQRHQDTLLEAQQREEDRQSRERVAAAKDETQRMVAQSQEKDDLLRARGGLGPQPSLPGVG